MHTLPINIPRTNNTIMHKSTSFTKSPSPSPSSSFTSSSLTPIQSSSLPFRLAQKKVVLYGAPFKNNESISYLIKDCIDEVDNENITKKINEAKMSNKDSITIITCNETKAFTYCQRLVENGLDAHIENA